MLAGVLSKTGQVMRVSAVLATIEHYLEATLLSRSAGLLQEVDVTSVLGALQIVSHFQAPALKLAHSKKEEAVKPAPLPKQSAPPPLHCGSNNSAKAKHAPRL